MKIKHKDLKKQKTDKTFKLTIDTPATEWNKVTDSFTLSSSHVMPNKEMQNKEPYSFETFPFSTNCS